MIPPFDRAGNLPPGLHGASWQEFAVRFGRNQPRRWLLQGLRAALMALKAAGCRWAYINGSFVTRKQRPRDYDACWETTGVDLRRLDPVLLMFDQGRAAQK